MKRIIFSTTVSVLTRILLGAGIAVSVASCGGGSDSATYGDSTSVGSNQAMSAVDENSNIGSPLYAPAKTISSWTNCATEGGTCSYSGTRQVRYGANGAYVYRTLTGPAQCTNVVFGDPAPGMTKSCAYSSTTTTTTEPAPAPTETWTNCASEGGTCSYSGTRQVRYGANGVYAYRTLTGPAQCTNTVFGDPVPGATKSCAYSSTVTTTTTTEPAPAPAPAETWTNCASEGGTCSYSGTRQVRYGANGVYAYRTLTGPVECTNVVFGDPVPGATKACAYSSTTTSTTTTTTEPAPAPAPTETWTNCASEGGTCSYSGTRQVRYGANGVYAYRTLTGPVQCTNTVFGDPVPGATKSCAYSSTTTTSTTTTTEPAPAPAPEPSTSTSTTTSTTVLPIPTNVANGTTVSLQCGQTYQGTLELNGKSNITVQTVGTCGKASITPGRAITGWTQYQGNVYSAPIGFTPIQVSVAGKSVAAAHWPNQPQTWATSSGSVPNSDLNGATLVYLENQSVVQTQTISGSSVNTSKPFYVEGKLWMLDSPGEWAVSNGRLYMWTTDGQSPEGRTWAAANSNGINADNSSGITINGIKVFSAADGISANMSSNLRVINSEITNSARDGIWASGSRGLTVDQTSVTNARRNGINGWYSVVGAVITNSTVTNTGMVGKPTPSDAGIMFGDGSDNRIDNVRVTNSSYHGISVLHNWRTSVTNSTVDTACVELHDCGGIYTGARDQLPLNLRIEGNTVTNVRGPEGIAIYLDDSSNGVTVTRNNVSNSTIGMMLHNGFDNIVTYNTIASSSIMHLYIAQKPGYTVRNNQVTNNTFRSTNNEQTFNLESGSNLRTFATINTNTYVSTNPAIFGRTWDGSSAGISHSYSGWKSWMGQDAGSTMNGAY